MTGDIINVPGPCLDCGGRGRRLMPDKSLVCLGRVKADQAHQPAPMSGRKR